MLILAHRGNWFGPELKEENSLHAIRYCLSRGWGVETDIRRDSNGIFYISHDPATVREGNRAEELCHVLSQFPEAVVALNVKEIGYEADLLTFLDQQQVLDNVFLFDMELIEPRPGKTARLFRSLHRGIRLAARMSDCNETVEQALGIDVAEIIWLDEFEYFWVDADTVRFIKSTGKIVYAISPEIHGFTLDQMHQRWEDFYEWGIDGICTDYSEALENWLSKRR
jgi:hypothetical protein